MEKKLCPICKKQVEIEVNGETGGFQIITHDRSRSLLDYEDEDDFDFNVHMRFYPEILCEGSGTVFQND